MAATSSRRLRTPVLAKIGLRWSCTVFALTDSRAAICSVESPWQTSSGDGALTFGETVGGQHHRGDLEWRRLLDNHRDRGLRLSAEPGSMQDDPAAGASSNAQPWLRQNSVS